MRADMWPEEFHDVNVAYLMAFIHAGVTAHNTLLTSYVPLKYPRPIIGKNMTETEPYSFKKRDTYINLTLNRSGSVTIDFKKKVVLTP